MKERTKRLQALFCALAVTATSVGSPLVSVPVYAEETQGAEDTSEHPETENGKATDTSDNAISESPDQVEKLIPENPNPEPVTEDEGDSSQKTTVAAEAAQTPQAAAVQEAQIQEAQIQEAETVTPKESTLTVKINGTAASGESLEAAVTASGTGSCRSDPSRSDIRYDHTGRSGIYHNPDQSAGFSYAAGKRTETDRKDRKCNDSARKKYRGTEFCTKSIRK
ncbi:MAG: hypothetical protein ACLSHW_02480 [Lachnospiraceae bacterium]